MKKRVFLCLVSIFFMAATGFSQQDSTHSSEQLEAMTIEELAISIETLYGQGKLNEVLKMLFVQERKVIAKHGNNTEESIEVYSTYSYIYEGLGDFEKAENYYLKTLLLIETVQGKESPKYIINLTWFGDFLKNKGDYKGAEEHLLTAFKLAKKNKTKFETTEEYSSLFGFLANYYRDTYQYAKALPLYLEQKELFEKEIGEQSAEYGAILSNIAILYKNIGRFEASFLLNEKAVAVTEKYFGTDNFYYGQRVNNLALSYRSKREYQTVDSLLNISLKNAEKLFGKAHHEYAIRLMNLGKNNTYLENFVLAKAQIEEAKSIFSKTYSENHYHNLTGSAHYANLLALMGENKQAAQIIVDAIVYDETGGNIDAFQDAGWILEEDGFEVAAEKYYLARNEHLLNVLKNQFEYFSEQEQLNYLTILQQPRNRFESYAFRNIDNQILIEKNLNHKINTKELLLANKNRLTAAIKFQNDAALNNQYETWKKQKTAIAKEYRLPPTRRSKNFLAQVKKINEMEGRLSRASVSFKKAYQFIAWKDIQQQLKQDEIVIEFSNFNFFEKQSLYRSDSVFCLAYIFKKDFDFPKIIPLFEVKELGNLKNIRNLYRFNENIKNNLNHLVWRKLEAELASVNTVYYSPSGLLHRINFGAIPINNSETIADQFKLYNLGSTRQLVFPHDIPNVEVTDAIIYGGIDYEKDSTATLVETVDVSEKETGVLIARNLGETLRSYRGNDWNYLEWTDKEAENIAQTLKSVGAKVTVQKGEFATEASFKAIGKEKPSPRILHLATHGYFFPKAKKDAKVGFRASTHPLIRSGLILAGANHIWKGKQLNSDEEDGILTAYEIAQMDLSNTELVVLSACETGLGDIENSEGVYGLQRAFKMAGVKYVLMSLWSVKDKKTYEFMTRFYELSQKEGKSIPEAYRLTQNEMRQKNSEPFNPNAWAGFVLVE